MKKLKSHTDSCQCSKQYDPKDLLSHKEKTCECQKPYNAKDLLIHKEHECKCVENYNPKSLLEHKEQKCFKDYRPKPCVVNLYMGGQPPPDDCYFTLFGYNRFYKVINYGSYIDANGGIDYTVLSGMITYPELLIHSGINPCRVKKWLFVTDNYVNFQQSLMMNYQDANGRDLSEPLHLQQFGDTYQNTTLKAIVEDERVINGDFFITGTVRRGSNLLIIAYPELIVNSSNLLDDEGDILEQFNEAEVSAYLESIKK